jgi:glycosyltransferase involved in cell wall biosynthesis
LEGSTRHVIAKRSRRVLGRSSRPRFLLTFLAHAARLSGGDRHLLEMAARWRDHVDVGVVAPPRARETVKDFLGNVEMYELGSSPPGAGARLALEYVRRSFLALARRLPRADVALASSHFTPDAAALASLARNGALGVGYVYHVVSDRQQTAPRTLWSRNDERVGLSILRKYAGLVFVSNNATAASLSKRGFAPIRTDVGIDLKFFHSSERTRLPNRGLFVGRMVASKGARDAVETWAYVSAAIPGAKLIMAGEGPERSRAIALARNLGIASAIDFVGFISEEEKRRLLQECSVFLMPSREEGWGIAVCEALASRIPVVAYRLPVLDELFPSSYLAAARSDTSALADVTVRVLADASFAAPIVQKGVETVSRYDVARVATNELEIILHRRALQLSRQHLGGVA